MTREKLQRDEAESALSELSGWTLSDDATAIHKRFTFRNFGEAFAFMTRVAMAAEKLDHHPEWTNVYKTIDVKLSTHDAKGLTDLDFRLAKQMDMYAAR